MRKALLAAALLAAPGAAAQDAARCLEGLRGFRAEMREEGLWLPGFRRGAGSPETARVTGLSDPQPAHTAPGLGDIGDRSGPSARARAAEVQAEGGGAIPAPWPPGWRAPPAQELRALQAGALVLARRGDEDGCMRLLETMRAAHARLARQMQDAGTDAGRITAWRRARIAEAAPVSGLGALRAGRVIGADIRSPRDEELGSIEDLVMAPESGRIAYAVVAVGGQLGLGERLVAVPWERLRASPGLDVFVLEATPAVLAAAPELDPEEPAAGREATERYWRQAGRAG